ncbi:hypothetical protein BDW62DRAFT_16738 [Aspergillus aurantiobrunneus]
MPGALYWYMGQCWKLMLSVISHCRRFICCTPSEFADLASLSELDIERQDGQGSINGSCQAIAPAHKNQHAIDAEPAFERLYEDYQFHEAQVHYSDAENPKIELVFLKGQEKAITTRNLRHLPILREDMEFVGENGIPMVEVEFQFYHWVIPADVPRHSLKGRSDFRPSRTLH